MPPNNDQNPEERFEDLLEETLKDVTVLKKDGKVFRSKEQPAPIPAQSIKDEAEVLRELLHQNIEDEGLEFISEESAYLKPGLQHQILRRLRRSYWVVQDELDLHGSTSEDARILVSNFLSHAKKNKFRCVRIIHGKGYRSRNREPVLKKKLFRWLQLRSDVLAYCEAALGDGGSGATMLLLKAKN
ncbi:MAG: Smr/MutS family protein [Proteobacteria bacterium]|nr:Smr/MutS family protein [Pseudomonadota bacterium]MDA1332417.1 Smr/MutS family protein [Pseudomonadota bacterium]